MSYHLSMDQVRILHSLEEQHVRSAIAIFWEAFAEKFHIGFSNADQIYRLFHDSLNRDNCIVAFRGDELLGILTNHTAQGEFFRLRLRALFGRFWPWRALRIAVNLIFLSESPKPDEFIVSSISVSAGSRGLGVGTGLMNAAEERARQSGKDLMFLDVAGANKDARRLYERLGYRVTATSRGRLIRWVTRDPVVHHMEKSLAPEE